ncbi:tonsoku-like protein [Procambarus clarkii]|uniref:tonsoku-like protein n=1 Tax=Procambarus clarkii TaxID=6728 RepID=UPI003743D411
MSEIARLEREKRRAENKNNLREVANLSNLLGQELQKAGDYEGALAQHREEGALCESLGDTIGVAVSHRRMGEVYCEMGQWKKALQHQHLHLSLAKEVKSIVEKQRAYATIGRTHLQRAEECGARGQEEEQATALSEAEKAFLQSLSTCEHLRGAVDAQEHSQMRCRLYLNLGLVLDYRGNTNKARDFIGQALDLCTSHSLYEDAQRCHSALGVILLREGILTEALQEGKKSLVLSTKLHDKVLQCEGHSFLAQVHLANTDYEAAKRCLYKAYKLKHPHLEDRQRIEKNLKTVVGLCSAEDNLLTCGEAEGDEKIKLYEKLGDGSANLCLYSQALEYYHKMLNLALKLDKNSSFLAPVYLSLAQTYSDNKQYKEAKSYYMKEFDIKVSEDYSEACKTLINVADTCEALKEKYETVSLIYQQAKELAMKAKNRKLEAYVLHLHSSLEGIPESVKRELEEEKNRLIEENDLDPELELSEEENESEDEIDLDLIYISDSDTEQENFDRPRQLRQKKSFAVKRNEKGETPLHKACIDGNLNMVKKLLQQGHPVNPRDNCGWLPIHEAANHGFHDIVLSLIEAGAWISDRGGQQCDGITPIHDAASCGNLEVVRLLMNRGASVISKTDDGDTPLESLVKYRMRTNLSQCEKDECFILENELKERMELAGHKIPEITHDNSTIDENEKKESRRLQRNQSDGVTSSYSRRKANGIKSELYSKNRSPGDTTESYSRRSSAKDVVKSSSDEKRLSSRGISDLEGDSEDDLTNVLCNLAEATGPIESLSDKDNVGIDKEDFFNPLLEDLHDEQKSATGTYASAISSVGSAAHRADFQRSSSALMLRKDKKVALVAEEEDVGDNWLDDDLGIFTKKRKRMEKLEFEYKEPRNSRNSLSKNISRIQNHSRSKKIRQMTLTSLVERYPSNIPERTGISDKHENETVVGIPENHVNTASETNIAADLPSRSNSGSPNNNIIGTQSVGGSALRLRVRVQNRVLLVPVAGGGLGRTVGWLAEEVTRRYYQLAGLRPHLTLTTQDGAVLDANDPITLVLPTEQIELQAQIKGWDLPPLSDRYTQACQALGCTPISSLNSILHRTEASTTLDLSRAGRLTVVQLQPVLRAVQCQQNLHCLNIANCRLGDDGFHHLMEALPSLPALEILDLRSTALTTSSLFELTEAITANKILKTLSSLDLSYNTFPGVKVSHIKTLFNLPSLSVLSLKHCCLSLTGEQQLPVVTSSLKSLALDYNTICSVALASLLSCLPQISVITLSGLNCKKDKPSEASTRLGVALSGVLGAGEECRVQHLDLSSCNLVDADLEDISAYLYRCPLLTSINLAHNPHLTSSSISALLNELTTNIILPLSTLNLHGNKSLSSDLTGKLASALQHKAATTHPITNLSLSVDDTGTVIQDLWKSQYQHNASIRRIGEEMFLSCSGK